MLFKMLSIILIIKNHEKKSAIKKQHMIVKLNPLNIL